VATEAASWPGSTPFVPRYGHAAVYDTSLAQLVVYGGEMGIDQSANTWGRACQVLLLLATSSTPIC
jgi:hypothetical protein